MSNCFPWEEIVGAEIVAAQAGESWLREKGWHLRNFMRIVDISEHVSDIAAVAVAVSVCVCDCDSFAVAAPGGPRARRLLTDPAAHRKQHSLP